MTLSDVSVTAVTAKRGGCQWDANWDAGIVWNDRSRGGRKLCGSPRWRSTENLCQHGSAQVSALSAQVGARSRSVSALLLPR